MTQRQARRFGLWPAVALGVLAAIGAGCSKEQPLGNVLRGNLNAEPQTLNPLCSKDVYATIIHDYIFESLIERDLDTLEWKGLLAERWEVSPDGLTITFHLDPKARFSDGQSVTADDVVFTIQTIQNPEIDCSNLRSYYADCARCEKVDDRTVRFVWNKPYFKSLEVSGAFAPILPKHVYAFKTPQEFNDIVDRLAGTGRYRFVRWKTGQSIVLERNPNYWGGRPAIERIEYRFILEDQAAVQAFLAGELDDLPVIPEWWVKLGQRADAGKAFQMLRYAVPANGYMYIAWNNARPLFADPRVRRAMTCLIDRDGILQHIFSGIGRPVTGPFWNQAPQYDASIQPWPYDRPEAQRLLKEAGWEDRNGDGWLEDARGKRLQFELATTATNPVARDIVRLLEPEFRSAGIELVGRFTEWSVFVTKLDNRDYDAIMLGWTGTVEDDPYQIWHSSQIEGRGSNHVGFRNADADRLIEEARAELDPARRNALYHRFHRIVHEEQPYTFMRAGESLRVQSPRIQGVRIHKLGLDYREWWIQGFEPPGKERATP
ncbi:MAG: peptide-binding protein [Planctomycetota bacterium]|nr:peptide-binding protein [Planctomycetota bacterium]